MKHDAEYCRRVAEAVGCPARVHDNTCLLGYFSLPEGTLCFRPDVDWNDAMWIAERAGILDSEVAFGGVSRHMSRRAGTWVVRFQYRDEHGRRVTEFSADESGPRAICEAILKMKERS